MKEGDPIVFIGDKELRRVNDPHGVVVRAGNFGKTVVRLNGETGERHFEDKEFAFNVNALTTNLSPEEAGKTALQMFDKASAEVKQELAQIGLHDCPFRSSASLIRNIYYEIEGEENAHEWPFAYIPYNGQYVQFSEPLETSIDNVGTFVVYRVLFSQPVLAIHVMLRRLKISLLDHEKIRNGESLTEITNPSSTLKELQ